MQPIGEGYRSREHRIKQTSQDEKNRAAVMSTTSIFLQIKKSSGVDCRCTQTKIFCPRKKQKQNAWITLLKNVVRRFPGECSLPTLNSEKFDQGHENTPTIFFSIGSTREVYCVLPRVY